MAKKRLDSEQPTTNPAQPTEEPGPFESFARALAREAYRGKYAKRALDYALGEPGGMSNAEIEAAVERHMEEDYGKEAGTGAA